MLVLLALVVVVGGPVLAQTVEAAAPWLTVYDEAGRPKWEVKMDRLLRTRDGWEGERVEVQLFLEGAPVVRLRASGIKADRYGREWALTGDVVGEGEGFTFACGGARWAGGLVLTDLRAEGRGLALSAVEAQWWLGERVELREATVTFQGWTVKFPRGRYALGQEILEAQGVTVRGHGVKLIGEGLTAWPGAGRIVVKGAHLVRGA